MCSLFGDAPLVVPRLREREVTPEYHQALFASFDFRSQDFPLRLAKQRLYIDPQVQKSLPGLDAYREERSTRWTLGVQNSPEEDVALTLFPVEVAASPRGTGLVLESDFIMRGQPGQEREAPGATENHQNASIRDTAPVAELGISQSKSEATSATPGVAVPTHSNKGEA